MGALTGTRVLDLGLLIQGPQAGATLADLGAEVIKVELPNLGDQARWIPATLEDPRPPFYLAINRGKQSVTIDLRTEMGRDVFLKLADTADVIISNFKPGTLDEWGLGYDVIAGRNPGVIYATGSVVGPEGPRATDEGADLAAQCAGGLISTIGVTGGEPSPVGVTIADHIASQNMVVGIMAALLARKDSGRGQRVDVSLVGGQIWAQATEITGYLLTGEQARPANRSHPLIPLLYGIFPTANGWIGIIGVPGRLRPDFCKIIDRPELMEHPAMTRGAFSPEEKQEIFAIVEAALRNNTSEHWLQVLRDGGQRCAPINDYAAVAADEHNEINGYIRRVDHPDLGPMQIVVTPIRLSDTPIDPPIMTPELGQDTELVLLDLGYDWDQIAALREAKAI